ncbi:MAG: hypothetical protein DHS20C15_20630 [Planctomycetota bacterium]|nr:MAG: hypothetical protein DHS20C15_20630 [Planctomycetota bacterium]
MKGKLGVLSAIVVVALYLFNMAFYAGSDIGHFRWRLEHGRLMLELAETIGPEEFYVAANTEPLSFAVEGAWHDASHWSVTLPLWIPLVLIALWRLVARARRSQPAP